MVEPIEDLAAFVAGAEIVMTYSGREWVIEQSSILDAVWSGALPGELRAVALRMGSEEGLDTTLATPEEIEKAERVQLEMICRWVRGVRWTCTCPSCTETRARVGIDPFDFRPQKLTPKMLTANPPVMSTYDVGNLRAIGRWELTPRGVDALARGGHGQMSEDVARRIAEEEHNKTLAVWAPFRREPRGVEARPDGAGMGQVAVGLAPRAPADHRPPRRRRPDVPAARRRKS